MRVASKGLRTEAETLNRTGNELLVHLEVGGLVVVSSQRLGWEPWVFVVNLTAEREQQLGL